MTASLILPSWKDSIAADRRWARLEDLCEDIVDCHHSTPDYVPWSGYLCARTQDFADGVLHARDCGHVSVETYQERTSRIVPRFGDLIYSREGSIHGIAALIPQYERVCLGQRTVLIRPNSAVADHRYIHYWMNSAPIRGYIDGHKTGSAAPRINLPTIRGLPVALPSLAEQQAIAGTLGALDDKIELNRRMNETLEAMARALFKSWFIDFDPVRANIEGRVALRLGEAAYALFPPSFADKLPSGWRVAPLAMLTAAIRRGYGPAYVQEGGVCVLNQKCIRAGTIDFSKARRHDASQRSTTNREISLGDVLVNSTGVGTLGRVAPVRRLPETTVVDSHVTIVRADPAFIIPSILGLDLSLREAEIESLGEGSTGQTELSRDRLGQLPVVVAPMDVQTAFSHITTPLIDRIAASEAESITLALVRDLLLPRLLSGELRVRGAEREVERVA